MIPRRYMRLLVPAGLIGALAFIPLVSRLTGAGGDHAWILYPALVALICLAGCAAAAHFRAWRWLVVPAAGFIFETGAILYLFASEEHQRDKWGGAIVATLLVMLLATFLVLLHWAWSTHRSGNLEKYLVQGMSEGTGGDSRDVQRIQQGMMDALATLRRAGKGRNAIYELPWFLVFGRPAAGKTVAIKQSGLGLPVRKDWVKGTGGTYTADWFFTNEMIFVDTPGRWVVEGADDKARTFWRKLLHLLLKFRGRRPLDGLIVVVPSEDLLGLADEEIEDQASRIRDIIDLIHGELRFQFPVYVLVSKCDLVDGFVDFFHALPPQRRHEILGWSNEDPLDPDVGDLVDDGFERVQRRLEAYRLEMVARAASRQRARRLFMFTEEFAYLRQPLKIFCETLFSHDSYRPTPFFRGFYFCSGTQGEGSPMSRAVSRFADAMGVSAPSAGPAGNEPKRSYFLLDLFRELMVQDKGLVKRSAIHWLKQHRDTKLGAFLPAVFFGTMLFFVSIAFAWNWRVTDEAEKKVTENVISAGSLAWTPDYAKTLPGISDYQMLLEHAKAIRDVQLDDLDPTYNALRWFGTDWHDAKGGPQEASRAAWEATLKHGVLGPMLGKAERNLADQEQYDEWLAPTCSQQLEMSRAILALRLLPARLTKDAEEHESSKKRGKGAEGSMASLNSAAELTSSLLLLWGETDPQRAQPLRIAFRNEFQYVSGARTGEDEKAAELLNACHATLARLSEAIATRCTDFCQGTRFHHVVTNVLSREARCTEPLPGEGATPQHCTCHEELERLEDKREVEPAEIGKMGALLGEVQSLASRLLTMLSREVHRAERETFQPIHDQLQGLPVPHADDLAFLVKLDEATQHVLDVLDDRSFKACGATVGGCLYGEQERIAERAPALKRTLASLGRLPRGLQDRHRDSWDPELLTKLTAGLAHWRLTAPPCDARTTPRDSGAPSIDGMRIHVDMQDHPHYHACWTADGQRLKVRHSHAHVHPHEHAAGDALYPCEGARAPTGGAPPGPPPPSQRPPLPPPPPRSPSPGASLGFFSTNSAAVRTHGSVVIEDRMRKWDEVLLDAADRTASAAIADKRKALTEAKDFTRGFETAWQAHVKTIVLQPSAEPLMEWLGRTADMRAEYQDTLLSPLEEALGAADLAAQAPELQTMLATTTSRIRRDQQKLEPFLQAWSDGLDDVRAVLEQLDGNPGDVPAFRSDLQKRLSTNAVVKLRNHVTSKGGFLADGGASFKAPLEQVDDLLAEMERGISVGNLDAKKEKIRDAWRDVQDFWRQNIEGRFPFNDATARNPVDVADLVAFFGQDSGLVKSFSRLTERASGIDGEIIAWKDRAQLLGQDLCKRDRDELKDTEVTIDIHGTPQTSDPHVVSVETVTFNLAGKQHAWSAASPGPGTIRLFMFGDGELRAASTIAATVAVAPSAQREYFDSKRPPTPGQMATTLATTQGPWSPLKLFRQEKNRDLGRPLRQPVTGEWRSPSGRSVKITLTLDVQAISLAPLAQLYPDGRLEPPPDAGINVGRLKLQGE